MLKIRYNKLWKLLIDKNMNKKTLMEISGVNRSSIAKLGRIENITTDILIKICNALDCRFEDIMESYKEE